MNGCRILLVLLILLVAFSACSQRGNTPVVTQTPSPASTSVTPTTTTDGLINNPVELKIKELKAAGKTDEEIVVELEALGMGWMPSTGAMWIGRTPSAEELKNLPPMKYPFRDSSELDVTPTQQPPTGGDVQ